MQDPAIQSFAGKTFKLALQFNLDADELDALCKTLQIIIEKEANNGLSAAMIAVFITRTIKNAIDMKFEEKRLVETGSPFVYEYKEPPLNAFKANLVRGMLITFIEHPRGYPGFFDIVSGIASAGLGIGNFRLPETGNFAKLGEIQKNYPDKQLLMQAQVKLMQQLLIPEIIGQFPNIRIGVYSLLTGCALLPFYAAALQLNSTNSGNTEELLIKASEMVKERFSGSSERLQKFLAQNLFRVLFEELFTHESTVFSLYNT